MPEILLMCNACNMTYSLASEKDISDVPPCPSCGSKLITAIKRGTNK